MKQYLLKNECLEVIINEKGAEIASVKREDATYMWYADPTYWGRTAPVLFPIVGMLKEKKYRYNGKTYEMGQHGLARDCYFSCNTDCSLNRDGYLEAEGTEIWFCLEDDEDTYAKYPFHFVLEIGYRLDGAELSVMWRVTNPTQEHLLERKQVALPAGGGSDSEEKELLFSIGGHPAFLCPWNPENAAVSEADGDGENGSGSKAGQDIISEGMPVEGFRQEGYKLRISKNGKPVKEIVSSQLEGPLLSNRKKMYQTKDGLLPITEHLFDGDALVLENDQTDEVALLDPFGKEYVTLHFDGPLMGIWSPPKKNAPFVCIEPWYGRCDKTDFDGEFSEREYGHRLKAGEKFEGGFSVEFSL